MAAMLWVGLGGFVGANARYLLGGWVASRLGTTFPYGTYVVNVSGSFILGFFLAFAGDRAWVAPSLRLLFAVGFVGAYTTFSTFEYESIRLLQERGLLLAGLYLIGSVLTGGIAVMLGMALGSSL
ncbi:MAG: fluoride efflux transporter CrcB [Deltaproteobacteria bacterium]|nr:fluoride efflux transporter CrcB [Deltaproteobacteria bacterium]MBV8451040.1 fluoride efflux transporter CrcB [Deltaproteobacteria bacterium]